MLKHIIHNHKKLLNKEKAEQFEGLIQKQTQKLQRYFKRYRKPVVLDIILSEDDRQYHMTLNLNMRSGPVIVKRKNSDLRALTHDAFDSLKNRITETLEKERKEHLYTKRKQRSEHFDELMGYLRETRETADRNTFEALLKRGVPGLRNYLDRRVKQTNTAAGEDTGLRVDDLAGELYTRIYDRFGDHPEEAGSRLSWMYGQADSFMEEKLTENDLLETSGTPDDARTGIPQEPEFTYSVDAEGELVPVDELDDPVFIHNMYNIEDIFTENPDEAEEMRLKVDERMTRDGFHHLVSSELATQPFFKRSVFDLYIIDRFEADEIADIKDCSSKEVEQALLEVRTYLKERIRSRIKSEEVAP
ncbi:HPF/RaiA family ribosome-associated protein [Natronogracilivirga saccharolytica]|uniref:Sigma-70 family RNA polymerase sigma factor n=1 Tax=Natronogracilivirga saccharolytica TaxID=2812953 RepID=A0A8J7RKY2_9BACT|nr:HPF/RaiA family ribosome-associated protein [Natronogracilivirga saccharolytica]MBP3192048.1 hypothetical protein [Natronogracilivirga saccharolytica]